MEILLVLMLALAPGLFWLLYFYRKDIYDPEPPAWIALVFLLGAAVTFPVGVLESGLDLFFGSILGTVVAAPVCEELAKFWVVKKTVLRTRVFDEPVDGIVYAAAAGLGFATVENALYIFSALDQSLVFALETAIVRGLLSVPGHVLFSVMWGSALGVSKVLAASNEDHVVLWGLGLAIGAHALFNLLLLLSDIGFALLVLGLLPLLWVMAMRRIRKALKISSFRWRW
ncbi:MAG: PrsW family glutamic-type intramembrane protease [Methanolinea sp.]|nr:PrsW family glutamic-type intramembrane protease [Methanolinea sp.]